MDIFDQIATIDLSRPKLNNSDGSFSTEKTITIESDGKHYLIPTIVNGQRLSNDQAIQSWRTGSNQPVGVFNSNDEAEKYAVARSQEIGNIRGEGDIFDKITSPVAFDSRMGQQQIPTLSQGYPSLIQRLTGSLTSQPFGSVGYNVGRSLEQIPNLVQGLSSPPSVIQQMKPGAAKALGEQLTLPNAAMIAGAPVAIRGLLAKPLGKAILATILTHFGVTGAQQAGTSFGMASGEPAGGQRRYDITSGLVDAATALPAAGAHLLGEAPTSGLKFEDVQAPRISDIGGNQKQITQEVRFEGAQNGDIFDKLATTKPTQSGEVAPTPSQQDPAILAAIKEAGFDVKPQATTKDIIPQAELSLVSRDPTKHLDYSPEDLAKYQELKPLTKATSIEQFGSPKYQSTWKEFEALRNKYNGNPPKQLQGGDKSVPIKKEDVLTSTTGEVTKPVIPHYDLPVTQESIKSAAARTPDGTIYTGAWHPAAYEQYMKDKGVTKADVIKQLESGDLSEGFVTSSGRFVSREEAAEIASKSNQFKPDKEKDVAFAGALKGLDKESKIIRDVQPTQKLYGGLPFLDPDFIKSTAEGAKKLAQPVVDKLSDYLKQRKGEVAMTYRRDAVDNIAGQVAREGANDVAGPIVRMAKNYKLDAKKIETALTPVREANNSKAFLEGQVKEAESGSLKDKPMGKEWLEAAKYGLEHWNVVNHVAEKFYKTTTDKLIFDVAEAGKDIEHREGYVRHLPESKKGSSFTHAREYATIYDRIKAGSDPKNINAVDLLRTGIQDAQKLYIQSRAFVDWGAKTPDLVSGKPLFLPFEKFEEGRPNVKGAKDIRPPSGYIEGRIGGQRVAVLEEYANVLHRLTDPSWFDKGGHATTLLKEAAGTGKHILFGFDTVHLARMALVEMGAKIGTGGLTKLGESGANAIAPSYKRGVLSLDFSRDELGKMFKSKQIDQATFDDVVKKKDIIDKVLPYGVNIGRVSDAIYQHWTEHIPITGHFQKWLFGTFQRGAMAEVVPLVYEMNKKQYPKWSEEDIARQTAKGVNVIFRNLGRQGLAKSVTGNDMLRLFLAAPQWTYGTLKYEGGAIGGAVKGVGETLTGKPAFNIQSRVVGSLIAGYILFNQIINYAITGHSTFENDEGHKLSAKLPDGFWLDPTAMALEATHAIGKALDRTEGDPLETAKEWLDPKLSTVARPVAVALTGKEYGISGPVIPKDKRLKEVGEAAIPKPIWMTPLIHPHSEKTEQQLLRSFGLNVDAQQTDRSQMYQLARKWMRTNNIKENEGDFPAAKYLDLNNALRKGDVKAAQKYYDQLKRDGESDELIQRYYKNYPDRGFTNSEANEEKFRESLSVEQRAVYDKATESNKKVSNAFFTMIGQEVPESPKEKKDDADEQRLIKTGTTEKRSRKRFSMFQ